MITKTKQVYVAFNGQEFDDENECHEYENELLDKRLEHLSKEQVIVLLYFVFNHYMYTTVYERSDRVIVTFYCDNNDGHGVAFSIDSMEYYVCGVLSNDMSIWELLVECKDQKEKKDLIYISSMTKVFDYLNHIKFFEQYKRIEAPTILWKGDITFSYSGKAAFDLVLEDYTLNPNEKDFLFR